MNNKPLVSIALCTYNGSKYIGEQLNSILNQTYDHIEVVICDDCSKDNTWNILTGFADKYNQIRLIKNEEQLGFNKNFEKAISFCSGEFIAISDQDDIWKENKIETLLNNINDNLLIGSNSELIDERGNRLGKTLRRKTLPENLNYKSFLLANPLTGHTCLFRKELLSKAFPLPEDGYYDWWFGFIAAHDNKYFYLNETLTYYRIHSESLIQREKRQINQVNFSRRNRKFELIKTQLTIFQEYKFLQKEKQCFITTLFNELFIETEKVGIHWKLFMFLNDNFSELFPERRNNSKVSRYFILSIFCLALKKYLSKN
ncbi:hypothetical protein C3K47_14195 [Solitalea longa]|uniref:Glycosyltransferase 2-like domain-containing protein n=1 Tax=Solitalea longa TaxID=2079460 RepID=A0A2S5A091_9SPHI|nr:glycosyltransferase [Solitalea longa]POY35543.1 hypothetical protein C3K47_14195 [Solitalea longa]